jgi:hypothetical protein
MKKQILNLGKALNKVEQRNVFGGMAPDEGPCRDAGKEQPAGCYCQRDDQCAGTCKAGGGGTWFYGKCVDKASE